LRRVASSVTGNLLELVATTAISAKSTNFSLANVVKGKSVESCFGINI